MEYVHLFETLSAFTEYVENDYKEPFVSLIKQDNSGNTINRVEYNQPHDYSQDYLTFEVLSDGYINFAADEPVTIEYSKNGGEWTEITSTSEGIHIDVVTGDVVRFKRNNATYGSVPYFFGTTCEFNVYGNIMSLIYGDNFQNQFTLESEYIFGGLFAGCTGLTNANNLILPATTLSNSCYAGMFEDCTSLVTTPELPATTLDEVCYYGMFAGCTSLTSAPELPATTLAQLCYSEMFNGCSSLVNAPVLPATTLAKDCYNHMFHDCTSLNYVKCLATDISAERCINNWLYGVSSTGTFVKAAGMNDWTTGADGIPSGWTVVDAE